MADNVTGIKFGVAGGSSLSGESGALIKQQLESIAEKIGKNLKVKVNIDTKHFLQQLTALQKEMQKKLGSLEIEIKTNEKSVAERGNSSGARNSVKKNALNDLYSNNLNQASEKDSEIKKFKEREQAYNNVVSTLDKLYSAKSRLLKLESAGEANSVDVVQTRNKEASLTDEYNKQYDILVKIVGEKDQLVARIKEQKNELDKATNAEIQSARQSQLASPLALNELALKGQSLSSNNGYEKIIERSKEARGLVEHLNTSIQEALNRPEGTTKKQLEELNLQFVQTEKRLKEIGVETDTLGNKVKEYFGSKITQALLKAIVGAFKQIYTNVKAINTAMTELKIATNATSNQIEKVTKNIAKSARTTGASITELINSTTAYAKLGYNIQDAQTLAEKTTIYSKVAGVNINEATTNITGINKAFNIGAEGLEAVLDQLIWIGNKFPISQAELGEAMNSAAESLASNGNTLQESLAIITAANNSLQNVSNSTAAVRTIAARISASTAELKELGESIDDVETFSSLVENMRGYGIEITDANGQLLSTYDILNKVASGWDNFEQKEKDAIATMLAGTKQQEAFYSIMQNWGDAQTIAARSGEATGSLMDAQATYLDSIEGQFAKLNALWEDFSTKLLDSELVKAGVGFLNGIVTGLNWLASWLPTAEVAISAIIFVILKLFTKIKGLTDLWKEKLQGITEGHEKLGDKINAIKGKLRELSGNVITLTDELNKNQQKLVDNTKAFDQLGIKGGATAEDISKLFQENIQDTNAFKTALENSYGITGENADAVVKWARTQQVLTNEVDLTTAKLSKAKQAQSTYISTIVGGIMSAAGLILGLANTTKSTGGKIAAIVGAIVLAIVAMIVAGVKSANAAMSTNIIFAAISLIVSALVTLTSVIKSVVPSFDNLKEKAKETKEEFAEANDALQSTKDRLQEVCDKIEELNAKQNPTVVDEEQLKYLQQEKSQLEEIIKQQEHLAAVKASESVKTSQEAIEALKGKVKNGQKDNVGWAVALGLFTGGLGNAIWAGVDHAKEKEEDKVNRVLKNWFDATEDDKKAVDDYINNFAELTNGYEYQFPEIDADGNIKELEDWQKGVNAQLDEYYGLLDKKLIASGSADSAWDSIISRVKNASAVEKLTDYVNGLKNSTDVTAESIKKLYEEQPDVKEFFDYLESVGLWDGANFEQLTSDIGKLRIGLAQLHSIDIIDDIDAMTDRFDSLSGALSDVAKNGIISLGTLQKLMDEYPDMLDKYFNKTLDGYKISDGLSDVIKDDDGNYKKFSDMTDYELMQDIAITDLKTHLEELTMAKEKLQELKETDDDYETAVKNVAIAQDNLNTKQIEWASLLREAAIEDKTSELEKMQDALEAQLDIYKDIIDIRKDLLETYKEEADYQKELAKKQKTVADLQTQLSLAKLDKSAAGQAKARELESQLKEAQEELDEYTLERAIQDITATLDNEYSEYEKLIKTKVDDISAEIGNIVTTLKDILLSVEGVAHTNASAAKMQAVYSDLKAYEATGMQLDENAQSFMQNVRSGNYSEAEKQYDEAKKRADIYGVYSDLKAKENAGLQLDENAKTFMNNVSNSNYDEAFNQFAEAKKLANSFTLPKEESNPKSEMAQKMKRVPSATGSGIKRNKSGDNGEILFRGKTYYVESKGDKNDLYVAAYEENQFNDREIFVYDEEIYGCLDGSIVKLGQRAASYKESSDKGYAQLKKDIKEAGIYHTGGFVGDVLSLKSNEAFAKLLTGEFVSTPRQMDTFMKKTFPAMLSSAGSGGATINNNSPLVEIKCGNVDDGALPQLKTLVDQAVLKIEKNMESALNRTGYKKKY